MISSANDSPLTPLRFLQRSAEVYPAKDAIVYGARRYTYAEFADVAQRFARALKARIEPGDRVVFLAPNLPEMLIAHFAVPLAGGVLVALNSRLAKAETDYILNHSEAKLLFVDAEFGLEASGLDVGQESFASFMAAGATGEALPWTVEDERTVITINYTSGTTG